MWVLYLKNSFLQIQKTPNIGAFARKTNALLPAVPIVLSKACASEGVPFTDGTAES